jgi:hypothetical protein
LSSTLSAAGVIQILSLIAAVILIAALIFLGSDNKAIAVLGAAAAAVSPVLITRYLDVRTEPVFIAFLLGSLVSLLRFIQTDEDKWLWVAGILTAACGLFRYAGLAVLAAGILSLFILLHSAWMERAGKAFKFAIIPVITTGALALRNAVVSGSATNRIFSYHLPEPSVFRLAAVSISEWILPASVSPAIRLVVLATIVGGVAALLFIRQSRSSLLGLLSIYAIIYSSSLALSLTFFDASIRLDNRMLAPLYVYFLVGMFTVLGKSKASPALIAAAAIAVLAIYAFRTAAIVSTTRNAGRGFSSRSWQTSPMIQYLELAPPSGDVYSNEALALYAVMGVNAFPAPEKTDPVKGAPRIDYETQLADMRLRLSEPESVLVLFHPNQLRDGMPELEELTDGLVLLVRTADADLYASPE